MAGFDIHDLWSVWRHGYVIGHRIAREERLALYADRPPECKMHGGPCIGRPECTAERLQNEAN